MELYIVRHGQSTNNTLGPDLVHTRVKDSPLTELGHRQAAIVAQYLADGEHPELRLGSHAESYQREQRRGFGITRLYCSAMDRALQTAQPISAALGLRPQVWVDIHEHGGIYLEESAGVFTHYPGMTRAEILARFADYDLPDDLTDRGWWSRATPDHETEVDIHARARRVADKLWTWAETDERIAIVSHGTFIDRLLKALFNQSPAESLRYFHYNTAITRVNFYPNGRLALHYLNRVDHLPNDLISA